MLTKIAQSCMFLSSYFPLYILIIIQNWNKFWLFLIHILDADYWKANIVGNVFFIAMLVLIVFSILFSYHIIKLKNNCLFEIKTIRNISQDTLSYFITYVIPILAIEITNPITIIVNALIFLILGVIYIRSDSIYLNPGLILIGYHVYDIDGIYMISNLKIDELKKEKNENSESKINARLIADNVYLKNKNKQKKK